MTSHPNSIANGAMMTDDTIDAVSKALRRAWQLGQTFWQQADSDSYKQQDKSDETQKKFEVLVEETRQLLSASAPAAPQQPAQAAAVRVCEISDIQCSRNCGTGACKNEPPVAAVAQDERALDLPKALRALADEYINTPSLSMQLLGLARAASPQATATLTDEARDAARYRWLIARFTGYDFDWMPSSENAADGKSVAVFEIGRQFRGGRDFTAAVDEILDAQASGG
jgi:hypothetical protein